MGLLMAYRQL